MNKDESAPIDGLVVGAGLAGLLAAHALRQRGLRVLVVDKGRSVGGRLATRRLGPGQADHGAQFFTVRTAEFQAWVDRWQAEGLVFTWATGWSDGSLAPAAFDGPPRYAVQGGMNALAKHLADGLEVQNDLRLIAVQAAPDGWQAIAETGQRYAARGLLLTPPVPQSLTLLQAGAVPLAATDRAALARIRYAPCLAGLFWVDRPPLLPEPGALQRPGNDIPWMADNRRKGISPDATIITVHAGAEPSRRLYEAADAKALALLSEGLQPWLAPGTRVLEAQLKRWRYALPTVLHDEPALRASGLHPLVFAGDAFGGPRVEGAALSGLAAGQALADALADPL